MMYIRQGLKIKNNNQALTWKFDSQYPLGILDILTKAFHLQEIFSTSPHFQFTHSKSVKVLKNVFYCV